MGDVITCSGRPRLRSHNESLLEKVVYPLIYNKKRICACIMMVMFLAVFCSFVFCESVQAMTDTEIAAHMVENSRYRDVCVNIDKILNPDTGDIKDTLLLLPDGVVETYVNMACTIFKELGLAMLLIYWGTGFFDMIVQDNHMLVMEKVIRKLLYLIIGLVLIKYSKEIVYTCAGIGVQFVSGFTEQKADSEVAIAISNVSREIKTMIYNEGQSAASDSTWLKSIRRDLTYVIYNVELLLPLVITYACSLFVKLLCWSRLIEICILAVISPVMYADVGNETQGFLHTSAFRAIKNVFAVAMQGVIILIALSIANMLTMKIIGAQVTAGTAGNSTLTFMFEISLVQIVKVVTINKTSQFSRQMFGLA